MNRARPCVCARAPVHMCERMFTHVPLYLGAHVCTLCMHVCLCACMHTCVVSVRAHGCVCPRARQVRELLARASVELEAGAHSQQVLSHVL